MITIANVLDPKLVDLHVSEASSEEAVFQVASLLKGNPHVTDWQGFYNALKIGEPVRGAGARILFPHARTEHVDSMVISIGKWQPPSGEQNYIFVVGVPLAMASDYLRIMGAIGRILRNKESASSLALVKSSQKFIETLSGMEMTL